MNRVYRHVWSAVTRTWVAAAETAKGRSKSSAGTRTTIVALALSTGMAAVVMPSAASGAEPGFKVTDALRRFRFASGAPAKRRMRQSSRRLSATANERHPLVGAHMIQNAAAGMPSVFVQCAREMAARHHDRWDGRGYPSGPSGTQIPFVARLIAIADVYDALVHTRSYKSAFSHKDAEQIIVDGRGTAFDPRLVDLFEGVCGELARQLV